VSLEKLGSFSSIICICLALGACVQNTVSNADKALHPTHGGTDSPAALAFSKPDHQKQSKTLGVLGRENIETQKSIIQDGSDSQPEIEKVEVVSTSALGPVYLRIARATQSANSFADRALLKGSDHNLESHKQSLLPQVTPAASINSEGDSVAQLRVEQVLFDSGRYSAGKGVLLGEQSTVAARLRIEENRKIADAISNYIQHHHAKDQQALTASIAKLYGRFERQSQSRLANGVGDTSERDLFNLKKIEAQADFENFGSEAIASARRLKTIAGIAMPREKPERMNFNFDAGTAPEIELANAELEQSTSQLELDQANRLPRLSLNGNVGTATDSFDQEDLDMRVEVSVNQPLTWGFDHSLASSRSQLEASSIRHDEAKKKAEDEMAILRLEIKQAETKIKRLKTVSVASEKRLKGFNAQFLAGKAGIVEVASIIETYKKSKMNLVDTRYNILNLELELAVLGGIFVN